MLIYNSVELVINISSLFLYLACVFNFLIYKLRKDKFYKEKMFWKIFQEMDPTLEYDTIQPVGRDYLPALKKNSELLEQFLDQLFNHGRTDLIKEIIE